MSVQILVCEFVSFASSVRGVACGSEVEEFRARFQDQILCEDHFNYSTGRHLICSVCQLETYESARIFESEHVCHYIDNGWDCPHFEGVDKCGCSWG